MTSNVPLYVELLCWAGDKNLVRVRIMEKSNIVLVRNAKVFVTGPAGATFAIHAARLMV
jgi:hypothetical protein